MANYENMWNKRLHTPSLYHCTTVINRTASLLLLFFSKRPSASLEILLNELKASQSTLFMLLQFLTIMQVTLKTLTKSHTVFINDGHDCAGPDKLPPLLHSLDKVLKNRSERQSYVVLLSSGTWSSVALMVMKDSGSFSLTVISTVGS